MKINSKEYLSQVEKYYDIYILGNEPMPENHPVIRKEIYDSWKRSKENGVDPCYIATYQLPDVEITEALSQNENLLRVAAPYVDSMYKFVRGSNFVIHLTDRNGCLLKYYADDEQIKNLFQKRSMLNVGAVRRECISGTDSAALCREINVPVQVIGAEHYLQKNHAFFCNSAPIHDPDNKLIGILTIMGPVELCQDHTLGLACVAANGIEIELRNQVYVDQLSASNKLLQSVVDNYSSAVVTIDNNQKIQNYNTLFKHIFNLPDRDFTGENIFSIIDEDSIPSGISNSSVDFRDQLVTLSSVYGAVVETFVSITRIRGYKNEITNVLITFTEKKKAQALAHKVSNFNATYAFDDIIGTSSNMKAAINLGKNAARSSSNVLIIGESGTGKELFAQAIHNASDRCDRPFVAINCGAIPKNLIESELFGYERGAFTGAKKDGHLGKFELADGGTLFLDEIGDMPLELQASLLRVLESQEIVRVGGISPKQVDVRIIAATNLDLLQSIKNKTFRSDLYYRLNVLSISLPPLRERKTDIPVFARSFSDLYSQALKKEMCVIFPDAMDALMNYNWPGNVRELENVIERAINIMDGNELRIIHLPDIIANPQGYHDNHPFDSKKDHVIDNASDTEAIESDSSAETDVGSSPEILERNMIIKLLKQERGHVQTVADQIGMPASTLYRKLRKYNINAKSYRFW
ncbi:MAG: sigma-54-dependent Fis family transcriptional regulator [Lentihominibacter sp.]|jgi:transcriptional regulator with PAS, ATPase and Fis domain